MIEASRNGSLPYLRQLQKRRGLLPYIAIDDLLQIIMINHYGLLTYWTTTGISDEDLPRRSVEQFLMIMASNTRGTPARQIDAWRKEVAGGGELWLEVLAKAHCPSSEHLAQLAA